MTNTTLTADVIKRFKTSDVIFNFEIPKVFQSGIEKKIGNGFRPNLVNQLGKISTEAGNNDAKNIAHLVDKSIKYINSRTHVSLSNVNEIIKVSLASIGAIIPHERIASLDEEAVKLIDIIDECFPNDDQIKIHWEIFKEGNPPDHLGSVGRSSGYLLPFEKFLHRLRAPLVDRNVRNTVIFSYPPQKLEAKKLLLVVLKRLFWFSGKLVEEWRDIDVNPVNNEEAAEHALKLIKNRKWFILEFNTEKAEDMVGWVEDLHYFAAKKNYHFVKIAVLADYKNIETPLRPYWRNRFGKAGATFERFPDGVDNFLEAIRRYDEMLNSSKDQYAAVKQLFAHEDEVSLEDINETELIAV